jgi:DNA invertase Pin-like site-specific DNA recombinase
VSTNGQTLASQDAQLHAAGAAKVYFEKASSAKTDRAELAKVLRRLAPGNTLMVTRLDRLARSTRDLLNILDAIGKARAGFKSLADPWADTTTPHGKLMVTVLAGLAEFERSLILARTGEGRARAKAKGVKFGRPPSLSPTSARKRCSASRRAPCRPILRGRTVFRRRPSADWVQPALSRSARSAREEEARVEVISRTHDDDERRGYRLHLWSDGEAVDLEDQSCLVVHER